MTGTSVFGIIINKFSHWKESSLVVLFKINKNTKIRLYDTILILGFAISSGVKHSRKSAFDHKEIIEG